MESYNKLIYSIGLFLKEVGFKKNGSTFSLTIDGNIGIINFQKSKRSTISHILFTINLGTYTNSLSKYDSIGMLPNPRIDGCQWKTRLNPPNESWWELCHELQAEKMRIQIISLLKESGIPQIQRLLVDENLIAYWRSGLSGGLSEQQRQLYLIALLKEKKKEEWEELSEQLLKFCKGKSFEDNIKENLSKIGIEDGK